jgi:transposase
MVENEGGQKERERESPPNPMPNPIEQWRKKTKPLEKRDFAKFKNVDERARKKKEKHGE